MTATALLLLSELVGCVGTTPVAMTGRVFDQPSETAGVVADATLETRDVYAEVFDEAVSESDGAFSVDVPAGQFFTVEISAEGHVPTSLSGNAGAGPFAAGDGRIWTMPQDEYDALFETWAGCPSVGEEGGVAVGQALLYLGDVEPEEDDYAINNGTVELYSSEGTTLDACYLDGEGSDGSSGNVTGATGRFAVFGVPEGASSLLMTFTIDDYTYGPYQWPVWVPGDGVAPLYPAYIEVD